MTIWPRSTPSAKRCAPFNALFSVFTDTSGTVFSDFEIGPRGAHGLEHSWLGFHRGAAYGVLAQPLLGLGEVFGVATRLTIPHAVSRGEMIVVFNVQR